MSKGIAPGDPKMSTGITIDVLPAARGDCLWIECARTNGSPLRLLFDGGMPSTWPVLRKQIADHAKTGPVHFDLAVVSHIDSDHIGGMLPLFASKDPAVTFGDIWFNGLPQLPDPASLRSRSVAEGERLVDLLSGQSGSSPLPWNEHFGRAAAMTNADGGYLEIGYQNGPTLTLLSPTPRRLESLRRVWTNELLRLQRGEPSEPPAAAVRLPLENLEAMAATETERDQSPANGSSIAFLLEYAGRSCLLAADAFSSVLGTALTSLANARDGRPIEIDVFKLPHHCSKGNVTTSLLRVVPAQYYVVSTNGDRFGHPDDIALARVVTEARRETTLWFNYATAETLRWSEARLQAKYHFATRYAVRDNEGGVRLELPGRHR
jgi:beta-lactamase superfamily II metal-dependent hydrolase